MKGEFTMVSEAVLSPHNDFFIDQIHHDEHYEMHSFHFHKKYEIYYLLDGACRYFIADSAYLVSPGNLVVIHSDEVHKVCAVGTEGHTRIVTNFSEEMILSAKSVGEFNLFDCFERRIHVVNTPMRKRPLLESIFKRLLEIKDENDSFNILKRKLLLTELLLYANECMSLQQEPEYGRVKNQLIEDIQQFITENYTQELNLTTIASNFYISTSYLSRLFKQVTTLSIVEYINSVRVMAAKNLLENTTTKVSEVALLSGFSTSVHFTRIFKNGTGLSPQQYRKMYRANF